MRRFLVLPFAALFLLTQACGGGGGGGGGDGSTVGMNAAPTVAPTTYMTARADSSRTFVLSGKDADGDALTFTITNEPNHGVISGVGATRTYTPEAGYTGWDWVEYKANDGKADSDTGWLEIEVFPADYNTAPEAVGRILTTSPNTPLTIDLGASDLDGDPVTCAIVNTVAHGSLTGTGAARTYSPALGFIGTDSFTFTASDGRTTTNPVRVWITVSTAPALGSISSTERTNAMDAMSAKMGELGGLSGSEGNVEALETYARTLPGVAMVGRSSTGVWGIFADGRSFAMVQTPADAPVTAYSKAASVNSANKALPPTQPSARSAGSAPKGIPFDKRAVLINGFKTASFKYSMTDCTGKLQSLLEEKGYTVNSLSGSVENFKALNRASVLHVRTHGGNAYRFVNDLNSKQDIYALWTTTEWSADNDLTYKKDLDSGSLVYMYEDDARLAGDNKVWHYGITKEFVTAYWTFSPDAYVHVSSCYSGAPDAANVAFRRAIYAKNAVRYGGWTYATVIADLDEAAKYAFDRLLGANSVDPKETPPQRPMDCESVLEDMKSKGVSISNLPSGNVSLFEFKRKEGVSPKELTDRLAPSIENIFATDAWKNNIEIRGAFHQYGSYGVELTVGGQTASIKTVDPDKITATLPDGASGDVIVKINGRESNRVRLCSWKGKITYKITGPGGLLAQFTCNARLVGDVHNFRDKAGKAEMPHASWLTLDPARSTASRHAEGTFTDGEHRQAWDGDAAMSVQPDGNPTATGVFSASGQMSASTKDQLWLGVTITHEKAWHDLVERWDEDKKTWVTDTDVEQLLAFPLAPGGFSAPGNTPIEFPDFFLKIPANLGPDGTIQSGKIGPESFVSGMSQHTGWTYYQEFSWETMTPESGTEIDAEMPR